MSAPWRFLPIWFQYHPDSIRCFIWPRSLSPAASRWPTFRYRILPCLVVNHLSNTPLGLATLSMILNPCHTSQIAQPRVLGIVIASWWRSRLWFSRLRSSVAAPLYVSPRTLSPSQCTFLSLPILSMLQELRLFLL